MEDASAVPEATTSEQAPAQASIIEEKLVIEGSTASPARAQSPRQEAADSTLEKTAETSAPTADTEATATKEESLEHKTEPKKEE